MSVVHQVEKGGVNESAVEEPPPPYAATTACSMEEGEEVKIQMIPAAESKTGEPKTLPGWLREMRDTYYWGDGKSCPLTCGLIPARTAAWALAPVYIVSHLALIVKLREPEFPPAVRGVLTIFAAVQTLLMALAIFGLISGKRTGPLVTFIFVQFAEAVYLSIGTVLWFCYLAINVVWCLASAEGDPFEVFTKSTVIAFAFCAFCTVCAHFCIALFIRVVATIEDSNSRQKNQ